MEKHKRNKGITLIALVITLIVLVILAAVTLKGIFGEDGLIDKTKRAKFTNNFIEVQELVEMYKSDQIIGEIIKENETRQANNETKLPVKSKLTESELTKIKNNIPTLEESIKQLSEVKDIKQANIYWIDLDLIGAKEKHKYLIDVDNMQIYDYEGEKFSKKRWHTLQMGVNEKTLEPTVEKESEMWDGWITLSLYYPDGATEKMWRLSQEGETRYDDNLTWEEYTGPITVRLSQVEDIWIKYKINGETKIIPPLGKLLVDIEVNPTGGKQKSVQVKINYDSEAELKQYRINGGTWKNYTEEFTITENVLIEAKGQKTESVYDGEGNLVTTQKITGTDSYFIRNIGTEKPNNKLPAPVIKKTEDGKIEIIYPENAQEKHYKTDYGEEKDYTGPIEDEGEIIPSYTTPEGKSESNIYDSETGKTKPYKPYEYGTSEIPKSDIAIEGPTIKINKTTEQATITVTTAKPSRKIYIKLGNGNYQEYTNPVTVNQNMSVKAYYITYEEGQTSKTSYARVDGLHQGNKPSVVINAEPYPYGNNKTTDKVTATITTNATSAQYSFDGITYQAYTEALTITENCRIYARATNDYGTTVEYLDITNISNTPPAKKINLAVSITVTPEPKLTTTLTDNVTVSISYDEKATGKYYSIGKYGELKEYTEPFKVTGNCTIYAYATSSNGSGKAVKVIDNITTGIAEPVIEANPQNNQSTAKTQISITFDKNSKTKRYEINGGGLRDYTGEFEVEENCTIRAVNTNSLGQSSESTYTVENIVAQTQPIILDKGDYYLIKLPYPENSTGREYKYGENGTWKSYKEDGIIIIKPEKKDDVLSGDEIKIKIEDENGKKINFKGDWYLLEGAISEVFANITMRWDRTQANSPNIVLNTTEPAKEITATIIYPRSIVKKQYKIVYPDGKTTGWKEYKEPLKIDQKGTIIYARGIDDAEVYSKETIKEITNIDEEPPIIKLTADLDAAQQKVGVKVVVTDDTGVNYIKYAKGNLGEKYFANNGTAITNNSIVNITENGIYTFYAEDYVGNTQIYTLTITNVDLTPPEIVIESSPDTVGTESTITIDYGDATTKQYKIGENTTTWTTYTGPFTITSYDVISAKAINSDFTYTVYAKGKDSAGNEITQSKKMLNLDLDAPSTPVITSNSGYPVLTEYGVKFDGTTTIKFDERNDIKNYYSTDKGTTWKEYTGSFDLDSSSMIIAKSVKTDSGLETIASKTVASPSDALGVNAYDGDENTYDNAAVNNVKILKISNEMIKNFITIKFRIYGDNSRNTAYFEFYDNEGTLLKSDNTSYYIGNYSSVGSCSKMYTKKIEIPIGTTNLKLQVKSSSKRADLYINEIGQEETPVISNTKYYPILGEYGITQGYNTTTIKYFQTSVKRLYKIDDGEWKTYNDIPIRLELGQTLYAKGINKEGKESYIASYTSALPSDALGENSYDGNTSTYQEFTETNKKLKVSKEMQGDNIYISLSVYATDYVTSYAKVMFYNTAGEVLSTTTYSYKSTHTYFESKTFLNQELQIPNGTAEMIIQATSSYKNKQDAYVRVKNIEQVEIPVISNTKYYPTLGEYGITQGYNTATIKYFQTSVKRLYKIDDGEWKTYNDIPIRLELDQKLYAKGINKEGKESYVASYTSALPSDALGVNAYDGNTNTYQEFSETNKKLKVSKEMQGNNIYVSLSVLATDYTTAYAKIMFYNASGDILSTTTYSYTSTHTYFESKTFLNQELQIPNGTDEIIIQATDRYNNGKNASVRVKNIEQVEIPVINNTKYYPILEKNGITQGYNTATIKYFQTSTQRLYKIDEGEWKTYKDKEIRLELGQILYAKGINKEGKETYIASYTSALPSDALGVNAYDGNMNTNEIIGVNKTKILKISSELAGNKITTKFKICGDNSTNIAYFNFCDDNGKILKSYKTSYVGKYSSAESNSQLYTLNMEIPKGTTNLQILRNTLTSSYGVRFNLYVYNLELI